MTDEPREPRDAKQLWGEVEQRLGDLGRAVRSHLEPESPDTATWSPPPEAGPGGGAPDDRTGDQWSDVRETALRLSRSAQRLAGQAGEAVRDPAVRESAQETAKALVAAISRTAEELAAQLRENVRSSQWPGADQPQPTPPSPVAPVAPVAPDRTEGEDDAHR